MPWLSQIAELREDIETTIESGVCTYLLVSSSEEEEDEALEDLEDLLTIQEVIDLKRYGSHGESAGRHGGGLDESLKGYIHR